MFDSIYHSNLWYNHSKEGRDHVKKAVSAFMDAGEYENAREILYALEAIDENNNGHESTDRMKDTAEKYLYGDKE